MTGKTETELTEEERNEISVKVEEMVKAYIKELGAEEDLEFYRNNFVLQEDKNVLSECVLDLIQYTKDKWMPTDAELIDEVVEDDDDRITSEITTKEETFQAPPEFRLQRHALEYLIMDYAKGICLLPSFIPPFYNSLSHNSFFVFLTQNSN